MILNRRDDGTERLLELAEKYRGSKTDDTANTQQAEWRSWDCLLYTSCYQLVKEHDRVGRMADTQEFENFVLEKRHISPVLMALLLQEAAEKITDLGEQIVIRHLYIERRMVPVSYTHLFAF